MPDKPEQTNKINSNEILFVKVNYKKIGGGVDEPYDGVLQWNGKQYYFKLSHEFDSGLTYHVYDNNIPFAYFSIMTSEGAERGTSDIYVDFSKNKI